MSHNHHPAIQEHGLQDNCPRCNEIADDPFIGLDDDNLTALVARTRAWMKDQEYPRSDTENKAMRNMEGTLRKLDRLDYINDKIHSAALEAQRQEDGPTDDEIYNRVGVEGGIGYDTTADEPGSLGENDWRL